MTLYDILIGKMGIPLEKYDVLKNVIDELRELGVYIRYDLIEMVIINEVVEKRFRRIDILMEYSKLVRIDEYEGFKVISVIDLMRKMIIYSKTLTDKEMKVYLGKHFKEVKE